MHAKAFPLFFHLWGQFCKVNISDNVSKKRIMNLCVIFSDVQVKKKKLEELFEVFKTT